MPRAIRVALAVSLMVPRPVGSAWAAPGGEVATARPAPSVGGFSVAAAGVLSGDVSVVLTPVTQPGAPPALELVAAAGVTLPAAFETAAAADGRVAVEFPAAELGIGAPPADLAAAARARLALDDGPQGWAPFRFNPPAGGEPAAAEKAGLEWFLRKKIDLRREWGQEHMLGHLGDYFAYAKALLAFAGLEPELAALEALRAFDGGPAAKDQRLDEFLAVAVGRLQARSRALDPHLAAAPGNEDGRRAVREIRHVLGDGPVGWEPFWFAAPGGVDWTPAPKPGLEGFLYQKLRQQHRWGQTHMLGQLDDYFKYLDALLASAGWKAERERLGWLRRWPAEPAEKDRRLNEYLFRLVGRLRGKLRELDPSLEGRKDSIYMILARAYAKLEPGKTIFDALSDDELLRIKYQPADEAEFARIKGMTPEERRQRLTPIFDEVWLLDIFEIGKVNPFGVAGGSPYSIRGYRVKEEHGGDAAFRAFVARAHALGLKVMVDFIPNHYSLDSDLLERHPEAFLHLVPPQPDQGEAPEHYRDRIMAQAPKDDAGWPMHHLLETSNYPEGGGRVRKWILVQYPFEWGYKWSDMAQIDYSRPEARAWQIEQARRLFRPPEQDGFDIDATRDDMSFFEANGRYFPHWLSVMRWMRGRAHAPWVLEALDAQIRSFEERRAAIHDAEILAEINAAVRAVKPAAFVISEVYAHGPDISRAGSNGLYNKIGLYEALLSRDPERIRRALRELAFALWQDGAAALVNFAANHDVQEGNPVDKFPGLLYAVLVNTMLFQPTLFYNGLELMVGRNEMLLRDGSVSEDDGKYLQKMIPFDARAWINWAAGHPERRAFLRRLLEAGARNRDLFRAGIMEVLEPESGARSITAWTVGSSRRGLLVAANWSLAPGTHWAHFRFDRSGLAVLGSFVPRRDRNYVLKDWAHLAADGGPTIYRRSGEEMAGGITIGLSGGDVHVIEVEEEPAGG